jgi:hypothetical protein
LAADAATNACVLILSPKTGTTVSRWSYVSSPMVSRDHAGGFTTEKWTSHCMLDFGKQEITPLQLSWLTFAAERWARATQSPSALMT